MEASIITVIVAIVASIPGILAFVAQHKKNKAEAADILTGAATALIAPLKNEIDDLGQKVDELGERVKELENENALLRAWAKNLCEQVIQLGGAPLPEPAIKHRKSEEKK